MPRFFLPPRQWKERHPALDPGESRHALEVLRIKEGGRLTVFDGEGREAVAHVSSIEGKHVVVELGTPVQTEPLACAITLAQAIPKGKNMDLIVQKAVELGAARIAPLLSERTVVQLEGEDASKRRVRLQEIALEACKQCGQNCLPEILEPATPARFLESHGKADVMLLGSLQPDARRIKTVLSDFLDATGHAPRTATVLIGPEGDFTPSEAAMARSAGCLPITLGPIILRSETAAIYCLSVLGHELY